MDWSFGFLLAFFSLQMKDIAELDVAVMSGDLVL
jgi:hypothetical protein